MAQNVDELRAALKAAEAAERAERDAKLKAVKAVYRYTIKPPKTDSYVRREIRTESGVTSYYLDAECINADEMKAVGHADHAYKGGGIMYLFNTATPTLKMVCTSGGGSIWIPTGTWGNGPAERERAERLVHAVERFLDENPEGGDITHIFDADPRPER